MQSRLILAATFAALLAAALAAGAQTVYRWVDKDGKVHFSDTPPPEDAKSVSQKRMGGYVEESQLPYATQVATKRNPVTLYIGNDCGAACDNGRDLLSSRGVPYTERNAQTNNADREALRQLAPSLEVPLLVVGENKVKGYDEDTWNAALDSAGYPRTRLPGTQAPVKTSEPEAPPKAPPVPVQPPAE